LGLGGYGRLPFARAAVHGEAAIVELLEHIPDSERPSFLALYPNWFGAITRDFGHEIDRVTIDHNVICGGPTKAIYRADWHALGPEPDPRGTFDALDTGDVVSERAHAYVAPLPEGGRAVLEIRKSEGRAELFDGGREIPEGLEERFVARASKARARVVIRTAGTEEEIDVDIRPPGARSMRFALTRQETASGEWGRASAAVGPISSGDTIAIHARRGLLRDFHVWLVGEDDLLGERCQSAACTPNLEAAIP
jgi:hypothetical protein